MPNCYQCGRRLPSQLLLRRKVVTGEFVLASYRSGKVERTRKSYGQRVVCPNCAKLIDSDRRKEELKEVLASIAILIVVICLFIWQTYFAN